jgi:acyl carrier protein
MNEQYNEDILKQVQLLFKSAMGEQVEVDIDTVRDKIGEWDSINHLNLIVELESTFDLGLTMEEIEKINSVRQIVGFIEAKKAG